MAIHENEKAELKKIGELNSYSRGVNTLVKVVSMTETREVTSRMDQSTHRVADALVGDDTGSIYLTLWDDAIDQVKEQQFLNIKNAYVTLFRGSMRLNLGRYGSLEEVDTGPFEEVNLDNNLSSRSYEQASSFGAGARGRERRFEGRGRRRY
ncbi:hypothetical protein KEJ21_01050 [Candidatus Bathyarchaeota archaeon]|nr:hypothetical protein [Candidatus Bathyarchaeota archaeon]MBS7630788.1 hypothetical protein [Candidatus Bathyarchaeota archaeon]